MHLIFLVDALDECEGTSITDLLSLFKELCTPRPTVAVKICVSSRRIPPEVLEKYPGFSLEDKTVNDISNWIEDKLLEFALDEEHKMLIDFKEEIVKKADGIFLWVELTMNQLRKHFDRGDPMASYRKSLSNLPGELTELFDNILKNVPADDHKERDQLLGINLCCRRPMNITEVRIAMALGMEKAVPSSHSEIHHISNIPKTDRQMIRMIDSRCGGLLVTKNHNNSTRIVQFVHQSVKEYFAEKEKTANSDGFGSSGLFSQGHVALSKACIRYCILKELKDLPLRLKTVASSKQDLHHEVEAISRKYPFLDYAVNHWMRHCEKAEQLGKAQTEELLRFERDGVEKFETWLELYNNYAVGHSLADDTTLFLIGVMFDLKDLVLRKIGDGVDIRLPLQTFGYYLNIAAMNGRKEMIQLLLANGADVNAIGGEYHTALQAAAYSGNKDAVEVLLDAGGDISVRGGELWDPLSAAASQNHLEIVDLLLEKGADASNDGGYFKNALRVAAVSGRDAVVKSLLNRGADASSYDEFGANIFFWAIFSASEETVNVIIESGADVHAKIYPGFTILHWISLCGMEQTVRSLLQEGPGVNEHDFNGSTPLHWAASNMNENVLETLLQAGADPEVANNYGITPLHLAAGQAGIAQVQTLLDARADVDACDLIGFSIFHHAALNRSADVLGSLLDAEELDFETEDVLGRRPIHIAAEFGCLASLELLADKTDNLAQRDLDGGTVLQAAARSDFVQALSFCLRRGLDVCECDNADMTALHYVFARPSRLPKLTYLPPLMNFLRQLSSDSTETGEEKWSRKIDSEAWMVLDLSPGPERETMIREKIELLLDHGANIDAQDENGNTALHLASLLGYVSAVRLLLSRRANHNLRDCRGFLPVDMASCEEARELLHNVAKP